MLLPPLCPVAKGKKVLFVLILEILDGNRAQSRSFWEVPKKCHCHCPIKLKKPKVTSGVAPMAWEKPEVSPTTAHVAEAILKKPDPVVKDTMTGVKPPVSANPLALPRFTSPSPFCRQPMSENIFLFNYPFPYEFDHMKIEEWLSKVKECAVTFHDIGAIVRECGHTDPDCPQCLQALFLAMGLPPPPPFSSPLPHSLVGTDSVSRLLLSLSP
jgi:hypothetical protein